MALQVNELRIGNLVQTIQDKSTFEIDLIMKFTIGLKGRNHWASLDAIDPIPLDEFWLLKMGFGKSDEHTLSRAIDERLRIIYDWHFKMLYMVVTFPDGDELSHAFTHIEHVHELQNFWWSLAAEELSIN